MSRAKCRTLYVYDRSAHEAIPTLAHLQDPAGQRLAQRRRVLAAAYGRAHDEGGGVREVGRPQRRLVYRQARRHGLADDALPGLTRACYLDASGTRAQGRCSLP